MTTSNPNSSTTPRNSRAILLVIVAMFFGSMLVAGALRFSGWRPHGVTAKGELLSPPLDARTVAPELLDHSQYGWNPIDRRWRILVVNPAATCDVDCEKVALNVDKVWQLMGKDESRVDILWAGGQPQQTRVHNIKSFAADAPITHILPAPRATETTLKGLPVYFVDPNGFIMMRYPPSADPVGIRADLAKLLKLQ